MGTDRASAKDAAIVFPPARPAHPSRRHGVTRSDELCQLALAAYRRLYQALACDDPDLGANIRYVTGRSLLVQQAQAEPWTLPVAGADRILDWVDEAMSATDDRHVSDLFTGFAESVIVVLDRRLHAAMDSPWSDCGNRAGDMGLARVGRPLVTPVENAGPGGRL